MLAPQRLGQAWHKVWTTCFVCLLALLGDVPTRRGEYVCGHGSTDLMGLGRMPE